MTIAFWDGRMLHTWDAQDELVTDWYDDEMSTQEMDGDHEASEQNLIPPGAGFADQAPPEMLIWPVEHLLSRPFSLPLAHPRLLDMDILGQELAGQAGIEPDQWWLSWQGRVVDGGVAGLVFGMPIKVQEALAADPVWQACGVVSIDAWLRLTVYNPTDQTADFAVLDADTGGLFAGVYHGGVWRGMRRLNLVSDNISSVADDALRSFRAMGFIAAVMPVYGMLDFAWQDGFASAGIDWQGEVVEELPDRVTATRLAALHHGSVSDALDFRHGRWAASGAWQSRLRPWRRVAILAVSLLLLVLGNNMYDLHQLQSEQTDIQQGIEAAFHQGLPKERVMLDPLAQLRKAAGGGSLADTEYVLRQLQAVGQLKQKMNSIRVVSMKYTGKQMTLSGMVQNLASVNRVRDILSSILEHPVHVKDTELTDQQVRFRIQWL